MLFALEKEKRLSGFYRWRAVRTQNRVGHLPGDYGNDAGSKYVSKSGLCDYFTKLITPVFTNIGIPAELIPLITLTPLSGSGSLSIFENLLKDYGCDSFIGRCASAVMASTETTFYVITVYYGAIGIKKIRHTAFASLCANMVSVITATLMVKLITFQ